MSSQNKKESGNGQNNSVAVFAGKEVTQKLRVITTEDLEEDVVIVDPEATPGGGKVADCDGEGLLVKEKSNLNHEEPISKNASISSISSVVDDSKPGGGENKGEGYVDVDEDDDEDLDEPDEGDLDGTFGTENESITAGGEQEDEDEMPLLFYTRVQGTALRPPPRSGSLPGASTSESKATITSLPFSVDCTCSVMGQIRWSPDMLAVEGASSSAAAEIFFRTGRPDVPPQELFSDAGGAGAISGLALDGTQATSQDGQAPQLFQSQPSNTAFTTQHRRSPSQLSQEEESAAAAAAAAKLCMEEPMPIVAMGFANGTVRILDGRNLAAPALPLSTRALQVRDGPPPRGTTCHAPIVAVCLDATGTCLAALDQAGMCTLWEYKLEFVRSSTMMTIADGSGPSGTGAQPAAVSAVATTTTMFSTFMSALTSTVTGGVGHATSSAAAGSTNTSNSDNYPIAGGGLGYWRMAAVQVTRITYPASFGPSTVLALDPAYKKRREKAILVGFADGRLVMTKRGLLFQRRVDNILYQQAGVAASDRDGGNTSVSGIQALVWRGSLVAWADVTGIRLMDADQLTRIAHIDPPVGARPSLYAHQMTHLKPHLVFETSHKLLVAWGDCLMQLRVQEPKQQQQPSNKPSSQQQQVTSPIGESNSNPPAVSGATSTTESTPTTPSGTEDRAGGSFSHSATAAASTSTTSPARPRPTVELNMAWHLDSIVACGVAPLDADHVMVLGAVVSEPPPDYEGNEANQFQLPDVENDIELQVVDRANGQVTYADLLPIVRRSKPPLPAATATTNSRSKRGLPLRKGAPSPRRTPQPESVANVSLLSTFCMPRMDNAMELQDQQQMVLPETSFDLFGGAAAGAVPGAASFTPAGVASTVGSLVQAALGISSFCDPHLRWNLNMIVFGAQKVEPTEKGAPDKEGAGYSEEDENSEDDNDADSVDSDIYDFVTRPVQQQRFTATDAPYISVHSSGASRAAPPLAPMLLVMTGSDAISVRLRTIDDAVDHALEKNKAATALQRAIVHAPGLRFYTLGEIVSEYFRALLRLPHMDDDEDEETNPESNAQTRRSALGERKLSLRRMKLAAYSMPVLLGGDVGLWAKWVGALDNIPGSLFVVWNRIPVRDPILPAHVYTDALCCMMEHLDHLRTRDDDGVDLDRLIIEAQNHFLQALLAWGSTIVLKEFLKLYKYQTDLSRRFSTMLTATARSLKHRYDQTSAIYLQFPVQMDDEPKDEEEAEVSTGNENPRDLPTLFSVSKLLDYMDSKIVVSKESIKVSFEAKARLCMMKGDFDGALKEFLVLGALHGPVSLQDVEARAVGWVMGDRDDTTKSSSLPHAFVVALIENRHLHQCLLDNSFLSDETDVLPLFALLRLVDLDAVGEFLMEHCVGPREAPKPAGRGNAKADESRSERSGSMPLDVVAAQLEASPKVLFWYLHALFKQKPELYVSFPKTANPPASITALHRRALDLYIKYAGDKRDSAKALEGIETYRVTQVETPLLAFIRIILQLGGGMTPAEVGKRIQIERRGGAGVSRIFALELAHIMENFGNETQEDSRLILDLYLKGAKSLMHAVAFAQRTKDHSTELWETLVDYCLTTSGREKSMGQSKDGSLFGLLLESAALSGANLAHLVSQIPPGMSIEGLRPRLVAAVADYRWKLQMHEGAAEVATLEKIDLLREVNHRSRRGARYFPSDRIERPLWAKDVAMKGQENVENQSSQPEDAPISLPPNLRPKIRRQQNYLLHALPYW